MPGSSPSLPVPLLDVCRDNAPLREATLSAFARVWESGRFLHGPEVKQLEERIAEISEVPHGIACASGSDALLLALMALDIGPGDEVIVPSFTFFATASAVARVGARVVFVDIDAETYNLDPSAVAAAITPRTKAIIPVHLYGQCAAMDRICEIGRRHGLAVIEDAAQAIGARYLGRSACSWGDIGCISFYPTKNLGGYGDGGMLTVRDAQLADKLRLLASHGMSPRYYHSVVGINSRLDTLQAAALLVKLEFFSAWTEQRRANAARYQVLFREAGLESWIGLPHVAPDCDHIWNQFTLRIRGGHRDRLRKHLTERGIGTEIYYPLPLHQQECFRSLEYKAGSLPETERAAAEVLHIPIFPSLREEEQRSVVAQIAAYYAGRQVAAA